MFMFLIACGIITVRFLASFKIFTVKLGYICDIHGQVPRFICNIHNKVLGCTLGIHGQVLGCICDNHGQDRGCIWIKFVIYEIFAQTETLLFFKTNKIYEPD